jgi:hypothetical protein
MSRAAKIVVLLVALITVGAALAAYFAYRNSADGQGGALWALLVLYGLVGAGVVWGVDSAVPAFQAIAHTPGPVFRNDPRWHVGRSLILQRWLSHRSAFGERIS